MSINPSLTYHLCSAGVSSHDTYLLYVFTFYDITVYVHVHVRTYGFNNWMAKIMKYNCVWDQHDTVTIHSLVKGMH